MNTRPTMNLRSLVRPSVTTLAVGGQRFPFEVANTPALRQIGLSGRPRVRPDTAGMVFAFPVVDHHAVWNAGMRFPFDIGFVGFDFNGGLGKYFLARVVTALPPTDPARPTTFRSPTKSGFILETPAGWFEQHGFRAGTPLGFPAYIETMK